MASKKEKQKEVVEEPKIKFTPEEIDERVRTIISLNKKSKLTEKTKQAKIYSAMANIQVERR